MFFVFLAYPWQAASFLGTSQADISQAALLVCFEKADYAALEKQFDCSGLVSWTVLHKLLPCLQ